MLGNKVLLVDADAQGNLTDSLGFHEPDNLPVSLATLLSKVMQEEPFEPEEGILHHEEGVDLMLETVKVPQNLIQNGISDTSLAIGRYATTDLYAGDYLTSANTTTTQAGQHLFSAGVSKGKKLDTDI